MRKIMMMVLALSLMMVLAACGDDKADKNKDKDKETTDAVAEQEEIEVSEDEKVEDDKVVTSINGEEVKGLEYNSIYAERKMMLGQQGQDISDQEQLKNDVLDLLINQKLLIQDAVNKGIVVTDEEIDAELDALKAEHGDQFTAVLEQANLTEEGLKEDIKSNLLISEYVDTEFTDIDVSEEEVTAAYEELKAQNEELPELEEVEEQLKEGLASEKEQEKVQAKLAELKEVAEIETMI